MALGDIMTNSASIADLERLEDEIGEALIHEVTNDVTISELKRRKLHLRDEIERLRDESSTPDEPDELLCCRTAMLGLDPNVIASGDPEAFAAIKRRCTRCEFRETCAIDLKRDPNNPVWESYCPNSDALNALTEAWWVSNVV
jgi:hypothetical protein